MEMIEDPSVEVSLMRSSLDGEILVEYEESVRLMVQEDCIMWILQYQMPLFVWARVRHSQAPNSEWIGFLLHPHSAPSPAESCFTSKHVICVLLVLQPVSSYPSCRGPRHWNQRHVKLYNSQALGQKYSTRKTCPLWGSRIVSGARHNWLKAPT
jgi:hypothetical protein